MVVIANPLYDVVFKHLMENERVVRFLVGTILDQTVVEVKYKPQEFTGLKKDYRGIAIFRLDFNAVIKTEEGELKNVLIEIQKAWNGLDLMRFRGYLADQYKRKDKVDGQEVPVPIVTIYILGYNLPEVPLAYIKVIRQYQDHNSTPLPYKSNFVENLTHDSYVVQVQRIKARSHTKLEKLLSLFEQTNFVGEEKMIKQYSYPAEDEDLKIMIDILHQAGTDPEKRKELEDEQEAMRTVNALLAESDKALKDKDKALEKKDKALEKNKKVIEKNKKEIKEDKKALEEKDKALKENKKALEENKKEMRKKDKALEEMARQLEELKRRHGKK